MRAREDCPYLYHARPDGRGAVWFLPPGVGAPTAGRRAPRLAELFTGQSKPKHRPWTRAPNQRPRAGDVVGHLHMSALFTGCSRVASAAWFQQGGTAYASVVRDKQAANAT